VPLDHEMARETVAMINVYYEDMHYTIISYSPTIDFNTLVAIVGNLFKFTYDP